MSVQAVEDVLRRAQADPAFREQLRHQPDAALHGYDIEYDERQALISGDALKLHELGVDQQLSLLADAYNPIQQEPTQ
ncbi:MAG: Os1348 family NHLP clan protein [Chloroflexota bacterium]